MRMSWVDDDELMWWWFDVMMKLIKRILLTLSHAVLQGQSLGWCLGQREELEGLRADIECTVDQSLTAFLDAHKSLGSLAFL